jgi:hypothetical protein
MKDEGDRPALIRSYSWEQRKCDRTIRDNKRLKPFPILYLGLGRVIGTVNSLVEFKDKLHVFKIQYYKQCQEVKLKKLDFQISLETSLNRS